MERDETLLALPRHVSLGLVFEGRSKGHTFISFVVDAAPANALNMGVLYAALDVSCRLALHPMLAKDDWPSVHGLHVAVMRALPPESTCAVAAFIVRRSRALAFAEAEARGGGRLVATARVTSTIVKAPSAAHGRLQRP